MKYLEPKDIICTKEFIQDNLDRIKNVPYVDHFYCVERFYYSRDKELYMPYTFDILINKIPLDAIIFLDKFNYINWNWCSTINLQMDVIDHFQNKLNWSLISENHRNINDEFILKFSDKLLASTIIPRILNSGHLGHPRHLNNVSIEMKNLLRGKHFNFTIKKLLESTE